MYRRSDPRWNRTIQHLAENLESANESAQANLWTFGHDYIKPCLGSIAQCFESCTATCFPSREERRRRNRRQGRGRAELSFDFYDDWEDDENDGLLGWGNDELDRLLSGSNNYGSVSQPARQRGMSYGARRERDSRYPSGRRKSAVQPHGGGPDPTVIPSSSYFGFLGRLPFKLGGKGLRYKPSAADLTEHPGASRRYEEEEQPLIEDSDEEVVRDNERKGHRRNRSHTSASGHTTDSLSSRGDIFPSDDEGDAVPLDDEFTIALERQKTSTDEASSGKTRSGKKPSGSRMSTRTTNSRLTQDTGKRSVSADVDETPTLSDLKQEEERIRSEEEADVVRKRHDAQKLAARRGLALDQRPSDLPASSPLSTRSYPVPMSANEISRSPLVSPPTLQLPRSSSATEFHQFDAEPVESQTAPESGSFVVDESDFSSFAPTPNKSLSIKEPDEDAEELASSNFVPARLPHFSAQPG